MKIDPNTLEFPSTPEYSKDQIRRVQLRLLEMAVQIKGVLERYGIPYFLSSGSLIGAIRHGGFIPWDDDLDLYLFSDTYDIALAALSGELPENLFVEYFNSEPKYFHEWAHVKDLHTSCDCALFPADSLYAHKGLSIDLYKMERMTIDMWPDFKHTCAMRYLERRHDYGFITEHEFAQRKQSFGQQLDQRRKFVNGRNNLIYGSAVSCHVFNPDDIFPLETIEFENEIFCAPHNAHNFLTEIYGNYGEIIPYAKRRSHYSHVMFLKERGIE